MYKPNAENNNTEWIQKSSWMNEMFNIHGSLEFVKEMTRKTYLFTVQFWFDITFYPKKMKVTGVQYEFDMDILD
jgi:hypothetical protein